MRQRAASRDGHDTIPVGTVVQLALDNVDRAKLDHTNATLVVVEHVGSESYRLANKAGVCQDVVSRAYLHPLAASPALVGLEHVLREWEGMPKVGIRKIAASLSIAGGKGLLHCACKGKSVTTLDAHASKQAASAIHAVIRVARHAAIMIDAAM